MVNRSDQLLMEFVFLLWRKLDMLYRILELILRLLTFRYTSKFGEILMIEIPDATGNSNFIRHTFTGSVHQTCGPSSIHNPAIPDITPDRMTPFTPP